MRAIVLNHISKTIKNEPILENINETFEQGNIHGIVGKNGAGKSMLFRVIAGLVAPTKGTVVLHGKHIGLMIEHASMYPHLTGFDNLRLLAKIHKRIGDEQIYKAIEAVGLDPKDKRKLAKYSLGMKQKIHLAQAMMEEPDFLLLDEPTNGLDDESVLMARQLIQREAERGAVILLASHNKDDIAELCTVTYSMKQGKLTKEQTL